MSINTEIERASNTLIDAYQQRKFCDPIRNFIGAEDLACAYTVQKNFNDFRQEHYRSEIIGRKVGVSAFAAQKQFGITHPVYGYLFNEMEKDNNTAVDHHELFNPKIEVEVAFIIKKDITGLLSTAQLINAIGWVVPVFEIVGSRTKNWDIKITDMVADNACASHFVMGHNFNRIDKVDLSKCEIALFNGDQTVTQGCGDFCLGSPLNALSWLAKEMINLNKPLRKDEIILSGALAPMLPIAQGDHLHATINGIGSVKTAIV